MTRFSQKDLLSQEDQRRISEAILAAEANTAGEIVCVLARASSNYMTYATARSALLALIAPWILIALTNLSVREIFLAQIVLFVVLFLILSESSLGRILVPHRARRAEAHRAAMEQFMIRGMARKKNRAGVQGNRI
jgi:putative membrane protein